MAGMARIVFVHGMSQEITMSSGRLKNKETLRKTWGNALTRSCALNQPGAPVLADKDIDLVYWAELYQPSPQEAAKGALEAWDIARTSPLRGVMRMLDKWGRFSFQGRPLNFVAKMGFGAVYQTTFYMANEPARVLTDSAGHGVYDQVQSMFRKTLEAHDDTCVVIGHSLGSVIAYEGLCAIAADRRHSVHTLITVGSPLGAKRLIYDRLRPAPEGGLRPWPGVRRWINLASVKDFACVPQLKLNGLFQGEIEDQVMRFGTVFRPNEVHKLERYFKEDGRGRGAIRAAVVEALQAPRA